MTNRSRSRAIFLLAAVIASAILALVATYAYGALFAHDRYWEVTKKATAQKDADLIGGMLDSDPAKAAFSRESGRLAQLFKGLDGQLLVVLREGSAEVFSNRVARFTPGEVLKVIELGQGTPQDASDDQTLVISRYQPPLWNRQFWRWLSQPAKWRQDSYNIITAPFVSFFVIAFLCCLALGWRARAGHLEREVLPYLRKGPVE